MLELRTKDSIHKFTTVLIFLGAVAFVFGLLLGFQDRVWHAYLMSYFYFVLLSLGALFFISTQYVSKAAWSVNIRRLSESLIPFLSIAVILTLPLLYGAFSLYDWLDPEKVAKDHLLMHKTPYLNFPFFVFRLALFFGGWIFFGKKLINFSLRQDQDGDFQWTNRSIKYSIAFLLFFSFSLSFFSIDFLMSLDAHWFSTIFGVYVFAGLFQSIFAVLILLAVHTMRQEAYKKFINENHLHDLGKFLLAATIFWAYIAFSQYMLIWYANLPEETTFFISRSKGAWAFVSIFLLLFKFVVPFILLLPRWVKRNEKALVSIAFLILLMQMVDIYWLVYPHFNPEFPYFGLLEALIFLGFAGLFIRSVFNFLHKHSPIPLKDPYGKESTKHHVTY